MSLTIKCTEVWVALSPIDLRRSIDGICVAIQEAFGGNPQQGLYVFYNTARNRLKMLVWHHNGFMLLYKRLERGRFPLHFSTGRQSITEQQLQGLLLGLDWQTITTFQGVNFDHYY